MKKNFTILFFLLFPNLIILSQPHRLGHYRVAVTTTHTAFPFSSFSKLFISDFHPGLEFGTGLNWTAKARHDWFQTFNLSYYYQRFVQHSISIYSEFGYRYKFSPFFNIEAKLGAGYLHAIPADKIFILRENGTYTKKNNFGKPQVMAGFSLVAKKNITTKGLTVFLEYQQRLQLPFIKSYVPILPSNTLMAGFTIPMHSK
jgi:hypothetical protein